MTSCISINKSITLHVGSCRRLFHCWSCPSTRNKTLNPQRRRAALFILSSSVSLSHFIVLTPPPSAAASSAVRIPMRTSPAQLQQPEDFPSGRPRPRGRPADSTPVHVSRSTGSYGVTSVHGHNVADHGRVLLGVGRHGLLVARCQGVCLCLSHWCDGSIITKI